MDPLGSPQSGRLVIAPPKIDMASLVAFLFSVTIFLRLHSSHNSEGSHFENGAFAKVLRCSQAQDEVETPGTGLAEPLPRTRDQSAV